MTADISSGITAAGGHLLGAGGWWPNAGSVYGASAPVVAPVPTPQSTGGASTSEAISAGQTAYNQLPGYAGDISTLGGNISRELSGQLPADVIRQIQQGSAERGVSTGSPGSPNSNASYLQALGLNSLSLQQTGLGNLNSTLPNLPGAAVSQNPAFYVTPALQQQAASQNAAAQTESNAQAAGLAAAQAGVRAGSGGGSTSVGPLPPTPNLHPGTTTGTTSNGPSYYAPPVVGWSSGGAGGGATGGTAPESSNIDTLNQILGEYGSTVNPNETATTSGAAGQPGYFYAGPNTDTTSSGSSNSSGGGYSYFGDSYSDSGDYGDY